MNPTGVESIVLAAGASSRLGRPKALLEFGDRTAIALVIEVLRTCRIERGVIVVGESPEVIEDAVHPGPFGFVRNPQPETGRTGSILVGLRAISPRSDVLLWPVDRPLARKETVRRLLEARHEAPAGGSGVIVPRTENGRGHPILLRSSLTPMLLRAHPDANLRDVLRESGQGRFEVPVDDPGIHFDLDTNEAYASALAWWREKGTLR